MRILLFSTLFPNAAMPSHGIFVENRISAFRKKYGADLKVIAPVPWFPFQNGTFGKYGTWARVPEQEIRDGVEIFHPRFLALPKIGMTAAPAALTRCFRKAAARLQKSGWDFDLIDAHYLYPDGVAAVNVAKELGKPVVVTARGSDVSLIPTFPGPRKQILDTVIQADAVIAVAQALRDRLLELGALGKIVVLRNGVDLERFKPLNRNQIREEMNINGPVIVSAGHLIDRKGHDIVIKALQDMPDAKLLIAGDGENRRGLEALARDLGLEARVLFLGSVPPDRMAEIYNAADILALGSSREGWPNVLLEAMACGTPCVASNVWGTSEVIRDPAGGKLVERRTPKAFARVIANILNNPPDRAATRHYAQAHSWDETTAHMNALFSDLAERARARQSVKNTPITNAEKFYTPKLIVTVDTEEQFDWADFDSLDFKIPPVSDIDRFQTLCAGNNITPLYFMTYAMLKHKETARYFRNIREAGAAECGLHLHQWLNEPLSGLKGAYFSFQKNLPVELHLEKLQHLAGAYEDAFGARAMAHRAGRYGIAPENYALLAEIGVTHDFSPSAGFDFSKIGGPDFSAYSNKPFIAEDKNWRVFVTPVSGARALNRTNLFFSQAKAAPGFVTGTAKHKRFTTPMRLSPEGANLDAMKALTRKLVADKMPALTFTLHSTSLTIGANPYALDAESVDRLLKTTRDYLTWFRDDLRGEFISLRDLESLYGRAAA